MPIPLKGDRSAFDTVNYPDLHGADIAASTPTVHNPAGSTAGQVPRWDGSKWVAVEPDVVHRLSGWLADDAQTVTLGDIPAHACVLRTYVQVIEAFDSDGTDQATVGYDADPDAYVTAVDVSATGIKTVTPGAGAGYDATARTAKAYYSNGGSEPTTGKALVFVEYIAAAAAPV